ncbi:hypothetical protein ES704_02077 [subsurface metagenome]|jgi:heme/copper-type cytochrome/quinol oxidase subunit 2
MPTLLIYMVIVLPVIVVGIIIFCVWLIRKWRKELRED